MPDASPTPVLARLAGGARRSAPLPSMTPARALSLAAMRAGREAAGLRAALFDATEDRLPAEALFARLEEPSLLFPVISAGMPPGLLALCPQAVAGLVEALTLGAVRPRPAAPRRPTRTDGAMAAGFADTLLAAFAEALPKSDGPPPCLGARTGPPFADLRAAEIALGPGLFTLWSGALDLADGAKRGSLLIALPEPPELPATATGTAEGRPLTAAVMDSEVRLEAVLTRARLPLDQVTALAAGGLLPLPMADLADVALIGMDGRRVAQVRLGRLGDRRAVRLAGSGLAALDPPPDRDAP